MKEGIETNENMGFDDPRSIPLPLPCPALLSPLASSVRAHLFFTFALLSHFFLDRLVHLVREKREKDKKTRASSNELEGKERRRKRDG